MQTVEAILTFVIEPEVENAAMESVRLHRTLRGLGVPADVVVVDEGLARRRSVVAAARWWSEHFARAESLSTPEHREVAQLLLQ
jgi:hypothetical protein